jgi:hypothetical protein
MVNFRKISRLQMIQCELNEPNNLVNTLRTSIKEDSESSSGSFKNSSYIEVEKFIWVIKIKREESPFPEDCSIIDNYYDDHDGNFSSISHSGKIKILIEDVNAIKALENESQMLSSSSYRLQSLNGMNLK